MMSTWQEWLFAKTHSNLESEQAYATRTVFSRMLPISLVYIDLGIHFTLLLFAALPFPSILSPQYFLHSPTTSSQARFLSRWMLTTRVNKVDPNAILMIQGISRHGKEKGLCIFLSLILTNLPMH